MGVPQWNIKERRLLRKYYPDVNTLKGLINKSPYLIEKKATELELPGSKQLAVNSKSTRGGDHRSPGYRNAAGGSCVYNPKRRSVKDIESDLAQIEQCIATGVDMEHWNGLVNKYNALQYEYSRALEAEGCKEPKRKNRIKA
ncbi:hypothetical protein [Dysgonomonas termitidis]|uniref:Uncharacterized protein n=1 Tax=Dysgonomonas termitidis TaxID=1516126 RepID=A0ABV9KVI6_9BACT